MDKDGTAVLDTATETIAPVETKETKDRFKIGAYSDGKETVHLVDPTRIVVRKDFNVREEYGDVAALTDSIRENGVRQPLKVTNDGAELILVDGHRRLRAVLTAIEKGATIKVVPVIYEKQNEEGRTLDMFILNDGKPLTPLEEAKLIQRLVDFKWEAKEIASKIGRSLAHISNALALNRLPVAVKKMVTGKKIAASYALEVSRDIKDEKKLTSHLEKELEKVSSKGKKKVTKGAAGADKKKNRIVDTLDQMIGAMKKIDCDKEEFLLALQNGQELRDELANSKSGRKKGS